jgi:hypothetical protein
MLPHVLTGCRVAFGGAALAVVPDGEWRGDRWNFLFIAGVPQFLVLSS